MELDISARSYDTSGAPYGCALAHLFQEGAEGFGTAVRAVEITFFLSDPGPPRKTLENLFETFHRYRATRLPKVTFRRTRQKVVLEVACDRTDIRIAAWAREPSVSIFQTLAGETVAALELLRKAVKPKDDFRVDAFLHHCRAALERLPRTDAELRDFMAASEAAWKARLAALSAWECLGIDFRDFHPHAREVLNDPWYWSSTCDFAPHGNDAGADLLTSYAGWLRRNPDGEPLEFYERLLKQWGFAGEERQEASEAVVALAFAEFKYRASCRAEVAERALKALARQKAEAEASRNWPHREERLRSLQRLADCLRGGPIG